MNSDKAHPLGPKCRKIHPKLRMIANGSELVNVVRAEHCAALSAGASPLVEEAEVSRGVGAAPVDQSQVAEDLTAQDLGPIPERVVANVFVYTAETGKEPDVLMETGRRSNLRTAKVPLSGLREMVEPDEISFVELGEPLSMPTPEVTDTSPQEPKYEERRVACPAVHKDGEGVLVGIIDCQGFDFAHPDFIGEDGKTRWLAIWDQGGRSSGGSSSGSRVPYGRELTKKQMDRAIDKAGDYYVPPQDLEPQSQMVPGSHGTHVASIAAGKSGVCRKAMIAGVLISLSDDDMARRKSFYDSTCLAHAVEYLIALAEEHKMPVSINISLGTNGHAHDGSAAISRWIDSALSVPGRSVCVSAGNAGQEEAEHDGDIGWIMGRIHTAGRIPSRKLVSDIDWLVVGNGIADISENELEIWYGPQDRFSVLVRPPGGDWIGPVKPRECLENQQLKDRTFLSVYNEVYHPANGSNYISVYLSPFLRSPGAVGVRSGSWLVRLQGDDVRAGEYHGWIERDDPRPIGRLGDSQTAWSFPSFFSERSNVDDHSVNSLCCGHNVVSVANLDEAAEKINKTSSQGPTRDGRSKPDIAAPGTDIVAAKGFAGPNDLWVSMSGTSMASPHVAGVIGLMLAVERKLTSAQILGILRRTGQPLPGADYAWCNAAGFGRIEPEACLEEARDVNKRPDLTRDLDSNSTS